MSEDIDFSGLTDDQIVELAIGLAREAMSRNPATAAAFKESLVSEYERAQAVARGAEAQKKMALRDLEEEAKRREACAQRKAREERVRTHFAAHLYDAARILGRPVSDITIVWKPSDWDKGGPRVQINLGTAGSDASWHLFQYIERSQSLRASPAARKKLAELQVWARDVCASVRVLNVNHTIVVKGVEHGT
jgi:hypothetical protein